MDCKFVDRAGNFVAKGSIPRTAYFPVCNSRLLGGFNVDLCGDLKLDQSHFFLEPVSRIDLTNSKSSINLWLNIDGKLFSVTGNSSTYLNAIYRIEKTVEAGIGWFKVNYYASELNLTASATLFIPPDKDVMFLWWKIVAEDDIAFSPISLIPIYGRSADSIRDHRHVTSLLNRVVELKNGIILSPTMLFDETGHHFEDISYGVFSNIRFERCLGCYEEVVLDGDLMNPVGLLTESGFDKSDRNGKEVVAAFIYPRMRLKRGEIWDVVLALTVGKKAYVENWSGLINSVDIDSELQKTKDWWEKLCSKLRCEFGNRDYSNWLMWVGIQPTLRKFYGCSFLPDFDYGRGGRGWRDLWQDLLGILLRNPNEAREDILNNFKGIRIDGSNATIIGKNPGEFIADRNKISRVWMDHGVWPWETLKLYIDQTGDWNILFEEVPYFRDAQIKRAKAYDYNWDGETLLKDKTGKVYKGTILEHILVQHLVSILNLGGNGNILLEDADWNDGLDMASERGESVAFTHFYIGNLLEIADVLDRIVEFGVEEVEVLKELEVLFELPDSASEARKILDKYFHLVQDEGISGKKIKIEVRKLSDLLRRKALSLRESVLGREIIEVDGYRWVNGYYDNLGNRVEGKVDGIIRMTLTGQVFALMKAGLDIDLAKEIHRSVERFLYDEKVAGYRLNTDFKQVYPHLGRAFSFAYGEKENGAVFSHMVVMYANALLRSGLVKEAGKVLLSLFRLATDFESSRVFPCLSEYYNNRKEGMYSYLTGSASWYVFTIFRYLLGIGSDMGDIVFSPKIPIEFFWDDDRIEVDCILCNKDVKVKILNPQRLDWGQYLIKKVKIGKEDFAGGGRCVIVRREDFDKVTKGLDNVFVEVVLGCAG